MKTAGSLSPRLIRDVRRMRKNPSPTQFDYLHLRRLRDDIAAALTRLDGRLEVLDVYCGTRPYEELLPEGSRCVGMDIDDTYGSADLVTTEFLPFPDRSFDLVLCTEAFHYIEDPRVGVAEIWRVLRPGGAVLVSVPFVWEYNRTTVEHRYTEPDLAGLFSQWWDVEIVENGGFAVSWATLTGRLVSRLQERVQRGLVRRIILGPAFKAIYLVINVAGDIVDRVERRYFTGPRRLPMNLLLTARRPSDG